MNAHSIELRESHPASSPIESQTDEANTHAFVLVGLLRLPMPRDMRDFGLWMTPHVGGRQ
jgi:hypothetical protein